MAMALLSSGRISNQRAASSPCPISRTFCGSRLTRRSNNKCAGSWRWSLNQATSDDAVRRALRDQHRAAVSPNHELQSCLQDGLLLSLLGGPGLRRVAVKHAVLGISEGRLRGLAIPNWQADSSRRRENGMTDGDRSRWDTSMQAGRHRRRMPHARATSLATKCRRLTAGEIGCVPQSECFVRLLRGFLLFFSGGGAAGTSACSWLFSASATC